jgi:superfamily II DNA/RNA helicase
MDNFSALGLPAALEHALAQMGFVTPTPIQAQAIPLALQGRDILGSAQTGTGKTGAYGVPLAAHVMTRPQGMALVLVPTRELAMQVLKAVEQMLGKDSGIRSALLIGGDSMFKQLQQLKRRPRLIVGTPGRMNDHLLRGSLSLAETDFLVLDESDRMLDMGFDVQLEKIASYLPAKRQTLMFSATLPPNIVKLADKYLTNPQRISVGETSAPAAKVTQTNVNTQETDKYNHLITELEKREGSFIVFVKTKFSTEKLAKRLREDDHAATAIHGDLRQRNREQVIRAFRGGKHRVLVATDIAARGLDISHIQCVVNYDLPQCPEDYIHRIGRTGRAGAEGVAINMIAPADYSKWKAIHRLMNPHEKAPHFPGKPASAKAGKPYSKPGKFGSKAPARHGENQQASPSAGKDAFKDRPFKDKPFKERPFKDKPFHASGDFKAPKAGAPAGKPTGRPAGKPGPKPFNRAGGKPAGKPMGKTAGKRTAKGW